MFSSRTSTSFYTYIIYVPMYVCNVASAVHNDSMMMGFGIAWMAGWMVGLLGKTPLFTYTHTHCKQGTLWLKPDTFVCSAIFRSLCVRALAHTRCSAIQQPKRLRCALADMAALYGTETPSRPYRHHLHTHTHTHHSLRIIFL